jgi:hypothetical protein
MNDQLQKLMELKNDPVKFRKALHRSEKAQI